MISKKLHLFLIIILSAVTTGILSAQDDPHACATRSLSSTEKSSMKEMLKEALQKKAALLKGAKITNTGLTAVPIKIHDITDGTGGGGVDMDLVNRDIANLNYHFYAAGIEFYICGSVSVYDNATYYDFDDSEEAALKTAEPMVNNALNLYLVNTILYGGSAAGGYAYYAGTSLSSTFCIIKKSSMAAAHGGVIVHEYGHHFGLPHTFEGTENGSSDVNAENVPRTGTQANCATKGDGICDTHADPRGSATSCIYSGSDVDLYGNPYTPPVDNIMSYYAANCKQLFTPGQISEMMNGLTIRQGSGAYTLNCSPASVTLPTDLSVSLSGSVMTLEWTDIANNELGYLLERSTTSATSGFIPVKMGGVAANAELMTDNTIAANTHYWYRIKASNGNSNTYSNVVDITTGNIYCQPTYNTGTMCLAGTIDNVTFTGNTTINNTTTCTSPAYTSYLGSQISTVTAGSTYNFSVTKSSNTARYIQVYIDFNNNGDFLDAGEKILADNTSATYPTYSGSITIPVSAINGTTVMRVILKNQTTISSACESNMSFGEAEDYGLTISGGVNPTGVTKTLSINHELFELYPNPGSDHVCLQFNVLTEGQASYKVYDYTGTIILKENMGYVSGEVVKQLLVSSLPAGIYIVQAVCGGKTFSRKMVIDHK